jgi:hypothetical protein
MTHEGARPLPLAFGYLNAQHRTPKQIQDEETAIADMAKAEGYALEGVYIETEQDQAEHLTALLVSARTARAQNQDPRAVFVPTRDDLGTTKMIQVMCRQLIEDDNALKVVFTR